MESQSIWDDWREEMVSSRRRPRSPSASRRRHSSRLYGFHHGRNDWPPRSGRKIVIFNLCSSTIERDLDTVFSRFGQIRNLRLIRRAGRFSDCFAFVSYNRSEEAKEAQETTHKAWLNGKRIRVEIALDQRMDNKWDRDRTYSNQHKRDRKGETV